jgi:hypothetical protein
MTDDILHGGRFASPRRTGNEIVRRAPVNANVTHRYLRHLRANTFDLAPQPLELLADGTERLSFLEGAAAVPPYSLEQVSEDALVSVARAARRLHDAGEGFTWPEHTEPRTHLLAAPVQIDCIGHGDLSPWNIVFDGSTVAGIIDWDMCGPSSRAWDFAYTAHHFVPFHPPHHLEPWGWRSVPDRRTRLNTMVDAYGADKISAEDVLDNAVVRLASIGAFLAGRARINDPVFEVHTREDHASAYFAASAYIVELRAEIIAR